MKTVEQTPDLLLFLAELSDLSRKHGVGIEGGTLFVMQPPEDDLWNYGSDAESNLNKDGQI